MARVHGYTPAPSSAGSIASRKRPARIEIDKFEQAGWRVQKLIGDARPKQVQAVIENGRELVKEAKGLGRAAR